MAIELNDPRGFIALRLRQLTDEEAHLRRKLFYYKSFSQIAILLGIIAPIFAGSALVGEGGILQDWKPYIALSVFLAALLTGIHKGLDCEAYHAECRRAIHALRSLIEGFEAALASEPDHLQAMLDGLELRLQHYREQAFDVPSTRLSE